MDNDRWFWRRVDTSGGIEGCWPWLDTYGQPIFEPTTFLHPDTRERLSPHRFAWESHYGQLVPITGRLFRMCDEGVYCCNPVHYQLRVSADDE